MKKAKIQGTTVVAAAENEGKRSFPAYLKDVIGVKADSSLKNKFDYYYKSGFMFAPCELASIKGKNELKKEIGGNSTAAAYISGHLARKYYYSIKKKQK